MTVALDEPIYLHVLGWIPPACRCNLPPNGALVGHGIDHLFEASNVAPGNQAGELALAGLDVLLGRLEPVPEAVLHDLLQLLVDLFSCPSHPLRVLGHLEAGDGHAAGVCCLAYGARLA